MIDAGVETPLGELLASVRSAAAAVDVSALGVRDAARIVEDCAEAERLLAALRVSAAATLTTACFWHRQGFKSVAHWMASKTGMAVGTAIATMEMADQLADLPVVAEAFRAGRLSEAQTREIADVASEVPDAQEQLVTAAGKLTLRSL